MRDNKEVIMAYTEMSFNKEFEHYIYSQIHPEIITRGDISLIAQKIAYETLKGNHVGKSSLIYELRIPSSSLSFYIKSLLEIEYIEIVKNPLDKRHTYYKATPRLLKGMEMGFLRDLASWIKLAEVLLPKNTTDNLKGKDSLYSWATQLIELEDSDVFNAYGDWTIEDMDAAVSKLKELSTTKKNATKK